MFFPAAFSSAIMGFFTLRQTTPLTSPQSRTNEKEESVNSIDVKTQNAAHQILQSPFSKEQTLNEQIHNPVPNDLWGQLCHLANNANYNQNLVLPKIELVCQALIDEFGFNLVFNVMNKYSISGEQPLTLGQFRAILVGIGAQVTTADLKAKFIKLKESGHPDFKNISEFSKITPIGFEKLILSFRSILSSEIQQTIAKSQFLSKKKASSFNQLADDLNILKKCELVNHFKSTKLGQNLATSEYLAHEIAYTNLKEGMIIPIKESNDQTILYEVKSSVNSGDGYICFILTPIVKPEGTYPIKVLYRGTNSAGAFCRLLEEHSAGHQSFEKYKAELIGKICENLPLDGSQAKLQFYGHSLGGADAQRGATALAEAIAAERQALHNILSGEMTPLRPIIQIAQVDLNIWNSTGVAHETNELFRKSEAAINDERVPVFYHKKDSNSEKEEDWEVIDSIQNQLPKVTFNIIDAKVAGDPVQRCGEARLVNSSQSLYVNGHVIKFDHGIRGIKPHCIKNLNIKLMDPEKLKFSYAISHHHPDYIHKTSTNQFLGQSTLYPWQKAKSIFGFILKWPLCVPS